jgi:hypothetical protein
VIPIVDNAIKDRFVIYMKNGNVVKYVSKWTTRKWLSERPVSKTTRKWTPLSKYSAYQTI